MLNVLRLIDDFDERDFEARTGLAFAAIASDARGSASASGCWSRREPGSGERRSWASGS